MKVDGGGKPEADVVFFYLPACGRTHLFHQLPVPGGGQQDGAGPGGGAYPHLGLEAQPDGAIGGGEVGYPIFRQIPQAKSVGRPTLDCPPSRRIRLLSLG